MRGRIFSLTLSEFTIQTREETWRERKIFLFLSFSLYLSLLYLLFFFHIILSFYHFYFTAFTVSRIILISLSPFIILEFSSIHYYFRELLLFLWFFSLGILHCDLFHSYLILFYLFLFYFIISLAHIYLKQ